MSKLSSEQENQIQQFELKPCHRISVRSQSMANDSPTTFTSSGRKVKSNKTNHEDNNSKYETVRDFDYEDELDLLVVLSSQDSCTGHIGLYDNQTGLLVSEIVLSYWDEDSDHSILMERDVIVHISKNMSRKFHCDVYRLTDLLK